MPTKIILDRGQQFASKFIKELYAGLQIKENPSTAFHPRTNSQSKIANKAVEQYLRHFVSYHQDHWASLLPTAKFSHNNQDRASTGISPFKVNYSFDLSYGQIPSPSQCLQVVEEPLKLLQRIQEELNECLGVTQQV